MSIRLYVGNLPKEPVEKDSLAAMFADEGQQVSTKVIKDRKTGKCRGFAFVTVPTDEMADQFIEKYNGQSFMDNPLKIEKALPRSKAKKEEGAEDGVSNAAANNKRKNNKRSKKQQTTGSNRQDTIQPDPRWADQLSKLKEMLAATNN
ncbi:RRM domain-containing RNA-binding protein [Hyella patelloides LEGE 07179]|uniref:RRM domain-containing RNA-binding protein n=1 Tax=Hyella patelloides LEGE 07179 TaxID=945734 RepID=A0A563VYV8_9CYAN|nr:RNA-binding protein [Hyella patelloides]VEP16638.1 RRM domain-containing RNA-binding protein [Hyella patelloides LEGE 07179]